jgi:hypothetical protein
LENGRLGKRRNAREFLSELQAADVRKRKRY